MTADPGRRAAVAVVDRHGVAHARSHVPMMAGWCTGCANGTSFEHCPERLAHQDETARPVTVDRHGRRRDDALTDALHVLLARVRMDLAGDRPLTPGERSLATALADWHEQEGRHLAAARRREHAARH